MPLTQVLSQSSAISFENKILSGSILNYTDQDDQHPVTNLLDPNPKKTYRTKKTFLGYDGYFSVWFDLGEAFEPTVFGIFSINLATKSGQVVPRIVGSDTPYESGDVIYSGFHAYEDHNGIMLWYLNDPSSGTAGAYRYWRMDFNPFNAGAEPLDDYWEIANIWLGDYETFNYDYSGGYSLEDSSFLQESTNGLILTDLRPAYITGNLSNRHRDISESIAIYNKYKTYKSTGHVLIDTNPFRSDDDVRGHFHFYAKLGNRLNNKHLWMGYASQGFDFQEVPLRTA